MDRREFLRYLGISSASVGAAVMIADSPLFEGLRGQAPAPSTEALIPGAERWVPSVCQLCPGGCGIRVRLAGSQPIKIEGNPLYPVNRGGLCPTGQAGLQVLYSPDRIKTPLKRVGDRGAQGWQSITWDEALHIVDEKLRTLRSRVASHKVVFLDGGARGLLKETIKRFLRVFGSPNYIDTAERRNRALPYLLTQGEKEVPVPDLANTNYILSFGCDLLEAEGAPVWQYRLYSRFREGKNATRGRLVVVDPRFSITAAKADKWIPINPGTEGALALGVAYVLIQEELYDKSFVERYTFAFDDWKDRNGKPHLGYRSLVLRDYYPEAVSTITGVPIEDIFQIARGFASHQPGVAVCGTGAMCHSNGFYTQFAIHSLNAMVGNLERSGGTLRAVYPPLAPLPEIPLDAIAKAGLQQSRIDEAGTHRFPFAFDVPSVLPENVLNGHPYDVELLILYSSNPLAESPAPDHWRRCFDRVPLIVGITSFMTESTGLADLILPEHVYLERWEDDWETPNVGFPHFGVRRPVVQPSYDTKHAGDLIITIAKKFGLPLSEAFPFDGFLSMMKYSVRGVPKSGRGAIISGTFEEEMMHYLKERGWRFPGPVSFDVFWKSLVESGGWFDTIGPPRSLEHAFQTPSGKFEFYVQRMEEALELHAVQAAKRNGTSKDQEFDTLLQGLTVQSRGDEVFLPHYEEAEFVGNEALYPLYLKPFHINTLMDGAAANTPAMMEMVGFRQYERWNSWVEINPETARMLGIEDGDLICVESRVGKIIAKAKILVGAMLDVVCIPLGMGRMVGGFANQQGANPMKLVAVKVDALSGASANLSTRVKVYKA